MIKRFWSAFTEMFGRTARFGLVAGALLIVAFLAVGAYWVFRSDYQPLFTDLTPQDTAAMTAELDRQKIPYVLGDQGTNAGAILVERSEVYRTRLKLMGKEIPLHGSVGFELFNNSDFGMTEFAQKINYQRALQGELTRTILSLSEIRDARVLLALPEQGLFKQATNKPKASVTLTLREGRRLRPEQVTGIQRLVASAVPTIVAQDVTIVDQQGIALTRVADGDDAVGAGGSSRLDMKKETEAYLTHKAAEMLERALGPGEALASVDVTLDMDHVQSNTDEVLSAPDKSDGAPTGVLVKERTTSREMEAPLNAQTAAGPRGGQGGSNQSESEYAVGHRVEQVITRPGAIRRIQVAVVVHKAMNPAQQEQVRAMVAACIGASPDRGDTIVVQTLDGMLAPAAQGEAPRAQAAERPIPEFPVPARPAERAWSPKAWQGILVSLVLLLLIGGVAGFIARGGGGAAPEAPLTDSERQAALAQVRGWMRRDPGGMA